jgi:glycosyltransferase involved in cell wall biosynthesis
MRVIWWGTYDTSMTPRTRILMDGLRAAGVEIVEIHAPIWDDVRHKALMPRGAVAWRLVRLLLSYPRLVARYLGAPEHDAVFAGCLGHVDVLVLWPFARLRRKPVIWDNMISLYSTVVEDRKFVKPSHPLAGAIRRLEALACGSVACVLVDTKAHAAYLTQLYGLPRQRVRSVLLGAERIFAQQHHAPRPDAVRARPRILFYGKFNPVHGIDVIVDAATSERGRAFDWTIVGTGQEAERIDQRLRALSLPHIQRIDWIEYEDLPKAIADADVCLGLFGDSGKTEMVVSNKAFQILAGGRRFVTRDCAAMGEIVDGNEEHIALVAPGDPEALLAGIERVLAAPIEPRRVAKLLQHITPEAIGRSLVPEIEAVADSSRRKRTPR